MNQWLDKSDISEAIALSIVTLSKFKDAHGAKYRNTLNSHVKGRFGEFALAKWLSQRGIPAKQLFREDQFDKFSDVEIPNAETFRRIEVKTWSKEFWGPWGRCVAVAQIDKISRRSDAILWCTTDLPPVTSVEQLTDLEGVAVEFVGYSTPGEALSAPVRKTGPAWRPILNHQLEDTDLHSASDLFAKFG